MLKLNYCQKIIIILFIAFISNKPAALGQFKNFGSQAKHKPQPNYFYSVYAYYDLVRERGVGGEYLLLLNYSVDLSAYVINPNTSFKNIIGQDDYYDLKGYGFSIKPKYHFSSLGNWYVSSSVSFEWLSHGKTWVSHKDYNHDRAEINYLEETKGKAFTVGVSFGRRISLKQFYLEPFIGVGITEYKGKKTTYETDYIRPYSTIQFPYEQVYKNDFLQLCFGLKVGFSFRKSKKHAAIDKKFDDVYIPKADSLSISLKKINFKDPATNKYNKEARARYEALNRNALFRYKRYYSDTTVFYSKVDSLFKRIDRLIIKGNR